MKFISVLTLFIIHIVHLTIAQHVAPGVPPQRYQQAPQHMPQQQVHPQQFQDVQMQQHQMQQQQHMQQQQMPQQQQMYQQAPVQHVPVQQVPVGQVPVQHIPVQQGHHPHAHSAPQPGQLLNAANIQHEKEHIAEHMEVPIDTSKMTDQELQFHYFKMHDADNNNKLDGCELIKSLIHWHEQGNKDPTTQNTVENKIFKDDELIALIDPILKMDDLNADGFIDYPEFVRAQQKAASQVKSP